MIKKILIVMGILLIIVGLIRINQPKEHFKETSFYEETIPITENKSSEQNEELSSSSAPAEMQEQEESISAQITDTEYESIKNTDAYFSITIDEETIRIAKGVDAETLKKTPGWLENSAKPGEEGVCVIYGHRNRKHLKSLERVKLGDLISVNFGGNQIAYTVEQIEILDTNDDFTVPTINGKHLMIATCYPFRCESSVSQKCVFWLSDVISSNSI